MMAPAGNDATEQVKFLVACIKHSSSGKVSNCLQSCAFTVLTPYRLTSARSRSSARSCPRRRLPSGTSVSWRPPVSPAVATAPAFPHLPRQPTKIRLRAKGRARLHPPRHLRSASSMPLLMTTTMRLPAVLPSLRLWKWRKVTVSKTNTRMVRTCQLTSHPRGHEPGTGNESILVAEARKLLTFQYRQCLSILSVIYSIKDMLVSCVGY